MTTTTEKRTRSAKVYLSYMGYENDKVAGITVARIDDDLFVVAGVAGSLEDSAERLAKYAG